MIIKPPIDSAALMYTKGVSSRSPLILSTLGEYRQVSYSVVKVLTIKRGKGNGEWGIGDLQFTIYD